MESILDAPSVRRATYRLSVANYHQLNEIGLLRHDVELLDGYLHQEIVQIAAVHLRLPMVGRGPASMRSGGIGRAPETTADH